LALGLITLIGFFVLLERFVVVMPGGYIVLKLCDLITVTVPPSLPVSLSTGVLISLGHLNNSKIFCISPNKIVEGGYVDTICFDKTGTLTVDEISLNSVIPFFE
jgi:cation-transporting ATPase 13A2